MSDIGVAVLFESRTPRPQNVEKLTLLKKSAIIKKMQTYLLIIQIIVSILIIILISLQQRGAALGSAFGGGGEFYASRRGLQKKIFYATIGLSGLFILLGILNLLI